MLRIIMLVTVLTLIALPVSLTAAEQGDAPADAEAEADAGADDAQPAEDAAPQSFDNLAAAREALEAASKKAESAQRRLQRRALKTIDALEGMGDRVDELLQGEQIGKLGSEELGQAIEQAEAATEQTFATLDELIGEFAGDAQGAARSARGHVKKLVDAALAALRQERDRKAADEKAEAEQEDDEIMDGGGGGDGEIPTGPKPGDDFSPN